LAAVGEAQFDDLIAVPEMFAHRVPSQSSKTAGVYQVKLPKWRETSE